MGNINFFLQIYILTSVFDFSLDNFYRISCREAQGKNTLAILPGSLRGYREQILMNLLFVWFISRAPKMSVLGNFVEYFSCFEKLRHINLFTLLQSPYVCFNQDYNSNIN